MRAVSTAAAATLPNFLIIGAAKCGTTSLYHYLTQHPEVFMSDPKEPKFFACEGEQLQWNGPGDREYNRLFVNHIDAYRNLFVGARGRRAVGEASAIYLYCVKAAERIQHYLPAVRMIAILRDPVKRAYSSFLHLRRQGREPVADFASALQQEEDRIRKNYHFLWHYKRAGLYYEQVKQYFDRFGREQVHVFLHDDLQSDPSGFIRKLFRVVGVDDSFVPQLAERHNIARLPKSRSLRQVLHGAYRVNSKIGKLVPQGMAWRLRATIDSLDDKNWLAPPAMPPEIRPALVEYFREDILKLQSLLQRDLSHWLH